MDSDGFSFFVLAGQEAKPGVDARGNPLRKRAQHRKSRNGCGNCRRKKIKCDEKGPVCSNCVKSSLGCDLETRPGHLKLKKRFPDSLPSPELSDYSDTSGSTLLSESKPNQAYDATFTIAYFKRQVQAPVFMLDPHINYALIMRRTPAEIELFRHYEKYTSKALAMSSTIWSTFVLRFALEYDFLMEAVLLVAASHINHYLPVDDPGRRPVLHYFARTLTGMQTVLARESASRSMTAETFDTIVSGSMLISHYCWTFVEDNPCNSNDRLYPFVQTVNFAQGMKDVVVAGQDVFTRAEWRKILGYSPKITLEKYTREAPAQADGFGDLFFHCIFCGQGTRDPQGASPDNMNAAQRLSLVLRAIWIALPNIEESEVAPDILRYLFTWPTLCTKGYVEQVQEGNMTALTMLLCYYAAILRVYSDKIWFMRDKAMFMYTTLRKRLEGRCHRCMKAALALYDVHAIGSISDDNMDCVSALES